MTPTGETGSAGISIRQREAMAVSTFRRIKQRPYTAWFTQGFLLYAIINQVNNKKSNTTLLSRAI